jgi:predicted Zn-dependent peptidase
MSHQSVRRKYEKSRKHVRKTQKRHENEKGRHKIKCHVFPNQLRMLYESSPSPNLGRTSIHFFGNFGSSQEPEDLRGLFHTIEHMIFKGTSKHNTKQLIEKFTKIGAYFNAYTSKRLTCYVINCLTEHIDLCLHYLFEMLFHSTFPKKSMMKEQQVIREENLQSNDRSETLLNDAVDMVLFEKTGLERPVDFIHPPLSRSKVISGYEEYYQPSKMLLSIVSSMSYSELCGKVLKNLKYYAGDIGGGYDDIFGGVEPDTDKDNTYEMNDNMDIMHNRDGLGMRMSMRGHGKGKIEYPYYHTQKYVQHRTQKGCKIVLIPKKEMNTVMISIGFKTCGWSDEHRETLRMLKAVCIRGLSGRLFEELREKHSLTYSPQVETEYYDKMGKFVFCIKIDQKKCLDFLHEDGVMHPGGLSILLKLIYEFISKGPTKKEWKEIKGYLKGSMSSSVEHISNLADFNGKNYLLRYDIGHEDIDVKKCDIQSVGTSRMVSYLDIYSTLLYSRPISVAMECIDKYFRVDNMCVCMIGSMLPAFSVLEKMIDIP